MDPYQIRRCLDAQDNHWVVVVQSNETLMGVCLSKNLEGDMPVRIALPGMDVSMDVDTLRMLSSLAQHATEWAAEMER